MKIFESLTRFLQGSTLVIALTFLVVGHLPRASIAWGQDARLGTIYADELRPQSSGLPNPWDNYWIDMGKCVVDYTSWIPTGIEAFIDGLIALTNSCNNMEANHPDVYLAEYADSSEKEQIGSTVYRGFYAVDGGNGGAGFFTWTEKISMYFLFGKVIYIPGEMRDRNMRDNCSVYHNNFHYSGGQRTDASMAVSRWYVGWTRYHLFERNCQHWSDWVLTGTHTGRGG